MAKQGFISWSGDESRKIAEQLQKLFGHVLAAPQMFVASKDLKAGEVWFTEIAHRLDACDVGVIVVTPQNVTKPWLHFESGAIAKRVGRSAAIPLLCGVSTGDLSGTPLAQLQAITTTETDVRELCNRLNELLELGLPDSHLSEAFPVWWGMLSAGIDNPDLWKGTKKGPHTPSTSDLSVQISQLSAAVAELGELVRHQAITTPSFLADETAARLRAMDAEWYTNTSDRSLTHSERLSRALRNSPALSAADNQRLTRQRQAFEAIEKAAEQALENKRRSANPKHDDVPSLD